MDGDTFFPAWERAFREISREHHVSETGVPFSFVRYARRRVPDWSTASGRGCWSYEAGRHRARTRAPADHRPDRRLPLLTRLARYIGRHHLALLALFVALGGTSYATVLNVPKASVGTPELKRNAVKAAKIAPNAVRTAHVS